MIELPVYDWFVIINEGKPSSNTYTGSCGTDPAGGCLSVTTFNYKVSIKDVGTENARILCNCFLIRPWGKETVRETMSDTEYECSPEGLEQAALWLNKELGKFTESE